MLSENLLQVFIQFGLAGVLGFLIGLEREMRAKGGTVLGIRDFVLFSLIGAISAYAGARYDNSWFVIAGFLGFLVLLVSSYWAERDHGPGITTELAALFTFFLGVLIIKQAYVLAIALAIAALAVLFPKQAIKQFRAKLQVRELQAILLFLTITFIILPVLPRQSLDTYLTFPAGEIESVAATGERVVISPETGLTFRPGEQLEIFASGWRYLGSVTLTDIGRETLSGDYRGEALIGFTQGLEVRRKLGIGFINVMLSAVKLYKVWLIVVLVSFISFVGYILIKVVGPRSGIGLTGLIGGLVSSTVTTLSFARRSREHPAGNRHFTVAILLAASIMFPRLIVEIAVVNQVLVKNIALPLAVMGVTGLLLAGYYLLRSREPETGQVRLSLDNPFSLSSAVSFALIFAAILMVTRLATHYLGNAWLPLVAIVSGLTDADAIAFSLSSLQKAQLISTDWASFNLVLGAISNTFMKLFLVLGLGHPALFRNLLVSFLIVGAVGLLTMFLYYDLDKMIA
jgi:uncharacterized membrane protein (DUF4010 family)